MILLSHIIDSETPTYGNRDTLIIEDVSRISDGASANSSKWTFTSNHLGTHIDMPKHLYEDGQALTDVPIGFWFSDSVQLIDVVCDRAQLLEMDHLYDKVNVQTEVLLIRTGYEKYRNTDKYWNDNPGLAAGVGKWLRENRPNIKMIGFDFISLTSWKYREHGKEAHLAFLNPDATGNPICIIEDMSLNKMTSSPKTIIISPIMIKNTNGAPVTVFASN